jgi:DNA-binding XRE family transcriptional regulator
VDTADLTQEDLAALLQAAERAHGEYERELRERDEDWPSWYAAYILDRLTER